MSERLARFRLVVDQAENHIENYTVPQYGDYPNDQLTGWKIDDFRTTLARYTNRIGSNARGSGEAMRDCLKMMHYAAELYLALEEEILGRDEQESPVPDLVGEQSRIADGEDDENEG